MIKDVRTDRMYMLADYLDTVNPRQFNMGFWGVKGYLTTECGFAGCAMGWAATSGLFEGLTLAPLRNSATLTPFYEGKDGFSAAMALFGLTDRMSQYFFYPLRYNPMMKIHPHTVASRLRRFSTKVEAIRARQAKPVVVAERVLEPA